LISSILAIYKKVTAFQSWWSIIKTNSTSDTMPKSLEKTRKKIAKKKKGNITALHENSRDSQRLRRANMRDDKLVRVASARRKNDQPLSTFSYDMCILVELMVPQLKELRTSKKLFETTTVNR
jgi:hypothetical protein